MLQQLSWNESAHEVEPVAALAEKLAEGLTQADVSASIVVVENLPDFLNTSADAPLQKLVRAVRKVGALLVTDGDTGTLTSGFGLLQLVKAGRHGIALQPNQLDGDNLFKTSFPRVNRAAFPLGRGFYVHRGQVLRVQCALPEEEP